MSSFNPEAQQGLTIMLDRWMGILGVLGIKNSDSTEVPESVVLRAEAGETVVLNAPERNPLYPDPAKRRDLWYTNSITAQQEIDGISHTLHVNSSTPPNVLASQGNQVVAPRTTAQAMLDLCLHSEVVQDR